MSHVPYRTGITLLFSLLRKICSVIVKYQDIMREIWGEERMESINLLVSTCEVVLAFPNPRPSDH